LPDGGNKQSFSNEDKICELSKAVKEGEQRSRRDSGRMCMSNMKKVRPYSQDTNNNANPDATGGLQVHLDKRPLRRPTKDILTIPTHKPHLASAIALEWDLLVSAQQALRHHLIPMTSLVSRALDIADEDANGCGEIRANIVKTLMRYLDTDSLLCWAPEADPDPPGYETHVKRTESLRSIQIRTAKPIIAFLTERVWPGVEIVPVLDEGSIMPRSQPQMTKDVIQGWVSGLPAFELAGLERGVLAGKGLLGAVRLLVEWSAELAHLRDEAAEDKFGVEEAAKAASLEVDWQTGMWGQVEDTHDVEREDIRRQLGSVVLLVSGQKA
jgi:ATP synthase F1 complex assembly factor 2